MFHPDITLGWTSIRRVSSKVGEAHVIQGRWREVQDHRGILIGYQPLMEVCADSHYSSKPTPAAISANESIRWIHQNTSQTEGLSELDRQKRVDRIRAERGRIVPMEDDAERLNAKVRVWPQVSGAKQDILRVWPQQKE